MIQKQVESELEAQIEAPVIERPTPTPTQEKKKKKDKNKNDVVTSLSKEEKLLPLVKGAHLSSGEIQTLIDILLNKQQASNGGDWVEKGGKTDPTTLLKRQ